MKVIGEFYKRAYEPYVKEVLYCLGQDVMVFFIVMFLVVYFKKNIFIYMYILYIPLAILLNYRLCILIMLERVFDKTILYEIELSKISRENSYSSKWGGIIPELYKNMHVNRYSIICSTIEGKNCRLRSVMSASKAQIFIDKGVKLHRHVTVVYGSLSKIIIHYEDNDDFSRKMNMMF